MAYVIEAAFQQASIPSSEIMKLFNLMCVILPLLRHNVMEVFSDQDYFICIKMPSKKCGVIAVTPYYLYKVT